MLRVGQEEVDAVGRVLHSGKVFRYLRGGECSRFERRYARFLGVEHVLMTASGTNALTAALIGLRVGPGDEVIVPSHTYMATAVAVLAAGAIPVIVDVDDSLTLDPAALEAAIGPQTRAVIPVHLWGLPCDMDAIMAIAGRRQLLVLEDACQGVGGAYKGRMLGSIGHAGAFSFNYFKNMTSGEGGAVVSDEGEVIERARCVVDCCGFYWNRKDKAREHFTANGARATEISGGILNVQLKRIRSLINATRRIKKRILRDTADTGLAPVRANSLDWECGTCVLYTLPTAAQADAFAKAVGCGIAGRTGRHVYTDWDPIFDLKGAHHPALNTFLLRENAACRKTYTRDMCARSLDLLNRTVMIGTHPDMKAAQVRSTISRIRRAARAVL